MNAVLPMWILSVAVPAMIWCAMSTAWLIGIAKPCPPAPLRRPLSW